MMNVKFLWKLLLALMIIGAAGGCQSVATSAPDPVQPTAAVTSTPVATQPPTATPTPVDTATPTLTPTPSLTPTVILPAEPRTIEFQAEDGQQLSGTYYPAGVPEAPILVLMHWAQGDQDSWSVVAGWVQDRGLQVNGQSNQPWQRTDWFPEFPDTLELAVFTFTFRGCESGCSGFPAGGWLLDAQAGMAAAAGLPGVDPDRVLAAGASIGADGAVDACSWWNRSGEGRCLGAFALSPGSYLTVPFDQAAEELMDRDPPAAVYCLFARRDDAALETCESFPGAEVIDFGYVEKHGLELIAPNLEHNTLNQLIQFLQAGLSVEN
jgi:hypothetical protein